MPRNSIILILSALVVVLVVAGLWFAGGPSTGRAEQRDETRIEDLAALESLTRCLAETANGVLPEQVTMTSACQRDIALSDPYTGTPYTYLKVSERTYKWCASFELPDRVRNYWGQGFDSKSGCVQFTYRP